MGLSAAAATEAFAIPYISGHITTFNGSSFHEVPSICVNGNIVLAMRIL
jgi:hypothetical protein